MPVIAVVDYNMGNLRSVTQALQHVAPSHSTIDVTSTPEDIYAADYVVFPGQGAARDCKSVTLSVLLKTPLLVSRF